MDRLSKLNIPHQQLLCISFAFSWAQKAVGTAKKLNQFVRIDKLIIYEEKFANLSPNIHHCSTSYINILFELRKKLIIM